MEVNNGAGQPVHFVHHHHLYFARADIGQHLQKPGPFHRAAADAAVRIGFVVFPLVKRLGEDIGLAGLLLVLQRVKLHIQAVFGRFTRIDCTVDFGHIWYNSPIHITAY